jgi:hypothetical protein
MIDLFLFPLIVLFLSAAMSPSLQTVIALAIVAMAAALLVRLFLKQRKQPGCGSTCGAISPEVRKLQARLRR